MNTSLQFNESEVQRLRELNNVLEEQLATQGVVASNNLQNGGEGENEKLMELENKNDALQREKEESDSFIASLEAKLRSLEQKESSNPPDGPHPLAGLKKKAPYEPPRIVQEWNKPEDVGAKISAARVADSACATLAKTMMAAVFLHLVIIMCYGLYLS
eukprot:CAMPEP_0174899052 /NCGR_PEP_ID=MMETSP0167-20121228/25168_1 /TAXON_ID=38298 /ORGANISM="Rhodella maculata, Strain CCMP736" /LENGTH=158 /DNA_ID=CAMNT_0016139897 /DNA_START=17 /DNA_END=493 /DNA_ORIENTATION=-